MMPIYLSRQIGNVFILSNEKEFEKIIKGKDGNTVLDYKQGDYPHVIMNNEVVVDVSNLKRIYSRTAFFRNRKEAFQHFSIPLDQKVKSQVFKTYKKEHKKWDDIKSLDTLANYHASYGKKEIYLEDLCKKGKLYCYDELFIYPDKRSTRDKPIYMYTIERTYFEQYWTKQNTIAIAGCLVTCVADVYSYYNPNNKKDPEDVDRDLDNMNAASREYEAAHPGDTSGRGYVEGTSRMNIGGLVTKEYGFTYKAITDRGIFTKELNDRVK
ncbi:MAG: hypothetical protein FWG49_05160, partial [Leptospirales bacterium]|nr:hypothetical protein [Leptospirales bacterium]